MDRSSGTAYGTVINARHYQPSWKKLNFLIAMFMVHDGSLLLQHSQLMTFLTSLYFPQANSGITFLFALKRSWAGVMPLDTVRSQETHPSNSSK
jgi:hypothetical protein